MYGIQFPYEKSAKSSADERLYPNFELRTTPIRRPAEESVATHSGMGTRIRLQVSSRDTGSFTTGTVCGDYVMDVRRTESGNYPYI
eukprot:scaffold160110_cov29-Prasinocladus_malaysianus.AAC.1